jgi:hypothetical protein
LDKIKIFFFYKIKAREFLLLPNKNNSRMKFLGSFNASELYANAFMLIGLKHRRFNKKNRRYLGSCLYRFNDNNHFSSLLVQNLNRFNTMEN